MSRRSTAGGILLAAVVLGLAGCAGPTRIATLNQTTRVAGAHLDATRQQQLATQGTPNATVSCATTIVVNVGPAVSWKLSAAGSHGTVTFTFKTLGGEVNRSSVKAR